MRAFFHFILHAGIPQFASRTVQDPSKAAYVFGSPLYNYNTTTATGLGGPPDDVTAVPRTPRLWI
jgi:hypothetical protein